MSRIIKPGDENFSDYELQATARKQTLLTLSAKWGKFLEATAQSCIETEVGKEFIKAELDEDIIRMLWTGGKQIEFEQLQQLAEFKEQDLPTSFNAEHIPLAVAEVVTHLVGVIQQNPAMVGSSTWRAFVLCVQLGILRITNDNPQEIPIEDVIDDALSQCTSKCLDDKNDYIAVKTVLATHLRAREEAIKASESTISNS